MTKDLIIVCCGFIKNKMEVRDVNNKVGYIAIPPTIVHAEDCSYTKRGPEHRGILNVTDHISPECYREWRVLFLSSAKNENRKSEGM